MTTNDVEVYQAYIEASEMFGLPLRLRVGRQEMPLGKGWLVDDITTAIIGRSFDALRLTYDDELFEIDAFISMLVEGAAFAEEDDDVTFAGVYGTYKGRDADQLDVFLRHCIATRYRQYMDESEEGKAFILAQAEARFADPPWHFGIEPDRMRYGIFMSCPASGSPPPGSRKGWSIVRPWARSRI